MVLPRAGRMRLARRCLPLLAGLGAGCDDTSSSPVEPPEDPEIHISSPTSADSIRVQVGVIELAGSAAIDAWSYTREIEPNVRWINVTTGNAGEAWEHVDWLWFFGYYPANHTWSASVPLVPGANEVRVEAYYSTSGTTVGSDTIQVLFQ